MSRMSKGFKALAHALTAIALLAGATHAKAGELVRRDALLASVTVSPTNGGINPDAFALVVKGEALVGGNPCQARGAKARLVTERLGDVLAVKAVITRRAADEARACTREWNPVYASLETTVRGQHSRIRDVVVKNVGGLGTDLSAFALVGESDETVVTELTVTETDAAYVIKGTVEAGSNPCQAAATEVGFRQQHQGRRLLAVPYRKVLDPDRICTMEYRPVYKVIETTVERSLLEGAAVFVANVDAFGRLVSVEPR